MKSSSSKVLFRSFIYSYVFISQCSIHLAYSIAFTSIWTRRLCLWFLISFSVSVSLSLSLHPFAIIVHSSSLLIFPNCYRYRSDKTLRTSSPLHLKEFQCEHVCGSLTHAPEKEKKNPCISYLCSVRNPQIVRFCFIFSLLEWNSSWRCSPSSNHSFHMLRI